MKSKTKSALMLGIPFLGAFVFGFFYLSANGTAIDAVVFPKKNSLSRVRVPFLTNGKFEVVFCLPTLTEREVNILLSRVNAHVFPKSRGTIVRESLYEDIDMNSDSSFDPDGRHFFFSFYAEGFGNGELIFEFQSPKDWPDKVRISVESLSL